MPAPITIPTRAAQTLPAATTPTPSLEAHRLGTFVSDSVLELEDPKEFAGLYATFVADYLPNPGIECELVRQLTVSAQRLRRFDRIENALLYSEAVAHTRHEANVILSDTFDTTFARMERIIKARAAAERSFNRVYKDLECRKADRHAHRVVPVNLEIEIDTRHQPATTTKPPRSSHHESIEPISTDNINRSLHAASSDVIIKT